MTGQFAVICDDYTNGGFRTKESAQVALERIEKLGACHLEHRVEETDG